MVNKLEDALTEPTTTEVAVVEKDMAVASDIVPLVVLPETTGDALTRDKLEVPAATTRSAVLFTGVEKE